MSCHSDSGRNFHHYQPGVVISIARNAWDAPEALAAEGLDCLEEALKEVHP